MGLWSIMVWGELCLRGRMELLVVAGGNLTAIRYRDETLDSIVRPFAGAVGDDFISMQDNARPHKARANMEDLNQEGV